MDLNEHICGIFYIWSKSMYHYLYNCIQFANALIISNVRLSSVWQFSFVLYVQRMCLHLTLTNSLVVSFIHKLVGFPPNFVLLYPQGLYSQFSLRRILWILYINSFLGQFDISIDTNGKSFFLPNIDINH